MSSFPNSPRLIKAGLVLLNPSSGQVLRVISLQYNPDNLNRTLQIQALAAEGADRSEALRMKGPPVETFKLEAPWSRRSLFSCGANSERCRCGSPSFP
jgi:hypothetical protein